MIKRLNTFQDRAKAHAILWLKAKKERQLVTPGKIEDM